MAKQNIYDTLVWLRKVKEAGYNTFSHADLVNNGLGNRPCLMQACKVNFVRAVSKKNDGTKTWTISEPDIMFSSKYKVFTGGWD